MIITTIIVARQESGSKKWNPSFVFRDPRFYPSTTCSPEQGWEQSLSRSSPCTELLHQIPQTLKWMERQATLAKKTGSFEDHPLDICSASQGQGGHSREQVIITLGAGRVGAGQVEGHFQVSSNRGRNQENFSPKTCKVEKRPVARKSKAPRLLIF